MEVEGVWTKLLLSLGITLLLVPSIFALDGEMFLGYFVGNLLCTGSIVEHTLFFLKIDFYQTFSKSYRIRINN